MIRLKCYLITLCSFLYFVMKVCLISPVLLSFLVHMASEVQIRQGSFKFTPRFPVERQKEVLLSFIKPSSISSFRDISRGFCCQAETQHLKKPPSLLQSLANLDCSWKIEFLNYRSYELTKRKHFSKHFVLLVSFSVSFARGRVTYG